MTPERIKELRSVCEAATPGLWEQEDQDAHWMDPETGEMYSLPHRDDGVFVAASRTALPEALDEIERLRNLLSVIAYGPDRIGEMWDDAAWELAEEPVRIARRGLAWGGSEGTPQTGVKRPTGGEE